MGVHRFVFPEPRHCMIDVGGGHRLLVFEPDEHLAADGANLGFEHVCGTWADPQEPDGEFVKVVAPRLSKHQVSIDADGRYTISPSILCVDCNTHGFIEHDVWRAA